MTKLVLNPKETLYYVVEEMHMKKNRLYPKVFPPECKITRGTAISIMQRIVKIKGNKPNRSDSRGVVIGRFTYAIDPTGRLYWLENLEEMHKQEALDATDGI